ncbi:hypothetical protein WP2_10 [Lactococcus phage WP-2]|uniref:Uncharacterized protein n=2 Tax=Viruses TaxID=10239 RepID=A0A067ZTB5_9VIRU|nr:hypothetical protein WP2_10 [Lactococcus phage WP-2]AHX22589.1 hypothetical protein [Bacteriophage sp.]AHZ10882.1 hypothetical protein WP2_10 [Lactococcus phage WP-2]
MKQLYFKPLLKEELHDSGYAFIEVGEIENGNTKVLAQCSDVINLGMFNDMPKDLNIDVTPEGTIRLWSHTHNLEWDKPIMSSAVITSYQKNGR